MMKLQLIQELNKLEIKSKEYLEEYVEFCLMNSNKDKYDCIHHILPKSRLLPFERYSNLRENPWNSAYLSYTNHFKAHWLLAMAIKHKAISFAFNSMKNTDISNGRISEDVVNQYSEFYSELRKENSSFMSSQLSNYVVCIDSENNTIRVEKDEYRNNKQKYKTHSDEIFNVTEISTGKSIRIHRSEYDKSIHKFHITGMSEYIDIRNFTKVYIRVKDREEYHIHRKAKIFIKRNNMIGEIYANQLLQSDVIISLDLENYRKKLYTELESKGKLMKLYDLYERKYVYFYTTEKYDKYRYFNITYKKKDAILVIDKFTNELTSLYHYSQFDINRHLYFPSGQQYYIDITTKEIVVVSDREYSEGFVKYNRRSAKKYLNAACCYNKTDNYKSAGANKVLAYDILNNKCLSVDKYIFHNDSNLVGIQSSVAKQLRKQNESK